MKIPTIFILLLFVAGCGPPGHNRLESTELLDGQVAIPEFCELISDSTSVEILEGLPHPRWESDRLESERQSHSTIIRGDFDFYPARMKMDRKDVAELTTILKADETFEKWRPGKFCGGYHPDFTTLWECDEGELEIQFCFGCYEARFFWQGTYAQCDLERQAYSRIKSLLNTYHKQLAN